MRSELHEDYLDAALSRGVLVGGPPWFGELERCLHRFWYQSLTPCLFIHAFHFIVYSMILLFIDYYENAMIIRLLTCMYSP